jgi:hypothetical protein
MADYNIAMGVKQPEPVNYLGQMAQIMGIKAMQDEMSGSEGVRSAIRGGMSPTDAKLLQYGKRGEAVYKAGLAGEKESLAATKSRFGLMGQVFGYVKDNPTLENANAALDTLGQQGVLTPEAVAQSKAQIAADPSKIVTYATQLFNQAIDADKQQADATSRRNTDESNKTRIQAAGISAGPGWAQANLAREKWKDELSNPKTTLQIIGNRVFDRNPRTGALTEVMDPTNALAPAQPPASMVNNMLADRNPTAITSLPPPVMSPQAFDTTRPPAPAAGPRPLVVPDKPLFENAYSADVGKATAASDIKLIDAAKAALPNITKLDEIQSYINKADVTTGLGADIIKNVKRAQAQFLADKAAGKAASDTEILDSMLGAGVFPMIQSLGVGARGMDTPAEREFLRGVMTGTISMNKDTLTKLTQIRRDLEARAVGKYNQAIDRGELTPYTKVTGRKLDKIKVPDAPTKTVVRTGTLNGRKVNEYSDGTADYAD